jgi:hypothetical protein
MVPDVPAVSMKRKLVIFSVAVAVALSWLGNLDKYSQAYLDDALVSGGLVYATARGINAAVSVLQGTEITPAVATIAVGQVLDPVNDLIERFSGMLLLALGSLALQKILLEIFSHLGFSILVTLLAALVLLTAVQSRYTRWYAGTLRLFIFTVAIRFALSLVVIASAAVNHVFLETADEARHSEMTRLEGELRNLSTARPGTASAEDIAQARMQIEVLRERQATEQERANQLRARITRMNTQLADMRSVVPLTCRLNPFCDEGDLINAKKTEIFLVETELTALETAMESTAMSMTEKREYLQCALREQAGESCSLLGRAYSWISPTAWIERFDGIGERIDDYASNIISLLVSFLAKTILIPLLFLYSAIHLYRAGLRRLALTELPRVS